MRAVTTNKRTTKGGQPFKTKHNDRTFDLSKAKHIDPEMTKKNLGWTWDGSKTQEESEANFFRKYFSDGLKARNEMYLKSGQKQRVQTIDDLRHSRKYCPEEKLLQIGKKADNVPLKDFTAIADEFLKWYAKTFPYVKILNFYLHVDEPNAGDHIHMRESYIARDKYGNWMPNQKQALKAMGIERPHPEQPESRRNNAKITFDKMCREKFLDIARAHGYELEREAKEPGENGLELYEYKARCEQEKAAAALEAQKEAEAARDEAIKQKEQAEKKAAQSLQEAARAKNEAMKAQEAARDAQEAQKAAEMEKDKVQVSLEKIRSEAAQKALEVAEKERQLTFSAGELAAAENQVTEAKKEIAELRKEKSALQLEVERLKAKISVWAKKLDEKLRKAVEKTGLFKKRDEDTITVSLKAWQDVRTEVDQIERVLEKEPYVSQEIDEAKRKIAGVEERAKRLQEEQEEVERERGQLARERLQFDSQVKKRAEKLAEKFLRENSPREWSISELRQELQDTNLENRQLRQKLYEIIHQRTVDHDRLRD